MEDNRNKEKSQQLLLQPSAQIEKQYRVRVLIISLRESSEKVEQMILQVFVNRML